MKRLLLGLLCLLLLGLLGPLPTHGWWWHHKGRGPAGAGADSKTKKVKASREKHPSEKHEPLYKAPKTVGWWHHGGPGPMGAGVK